MMKQIFICSFFFLFGISQVIGQDGTFKASVSKSEILLGNSFEVRFELDNVDGKFEAPDFKDFTVMSGPNTSMSMSMMNGTTKKQMTYSYILKPREIGTFYIEPAFVNGGSGEMYTEPITIQVLPNPNGTIEPTEGFNQRFEFISPRQKSRKPLQEQEPVKQNTRPKKRI